MSPPRHPDRQGTEKTEAPLRTSGTEYRRKDVNKVVEDESNSVEERTETTTTEGESEYSWKQ